jgi:hypothetical protein
MPDSVAAVWSSKKKRSAAHSNCPRKETQNQSQDQFFRSKSGLASWTAP